MSKKWISELFKEAEEGDLSRVREAVVQGLDPCVRGRDQETLLHRMANRQPSEEGLELARFLLDRGADPKARDKDGRTPLHDAAWAGAWDFASLLLEERADANSRNEDGETPLILAARGKYSEPDDEELPEDPQEALRVIEGRIKVIAALIARGVDANAADDDGETALQWACRNGEAIVARELLKLGVNPEKSNNEGVTPLHAAASMGRGELVFQILARNASPMPRDRHGHTPLDWAVRGYAEPDDNLHRGSYLACISSLVAAGDKIRDWVDSDDERDDLGDDVVVPPDLALCVHGGRLMRDYRLLGTWDGEWVREHLGSKSPILACYDSSPEALYQGIIPAGIMIYEEGRILYEFDILAMHHSKWVSGPVPYPPEWGSDLSRGWSRDQLAGNHVFGTSIRLWIILTDGRRVEGARGRMDAWETLSGRRLTRGNTRLLLVRPAGYAEHVG